MKPTEQQIRDIESRMRIDSQIILLWKAFAGKSEEFLTDDDANLFYEISKHPAIQSKLNNKENHND